MFRSRLFLLGAALLWSTAGAAIKLCTLDAWQIAAGRSLFAAATLFLALPATRKLPTRRAAWVAVAYAATVVLFVVANKLTTAANAIFIQDTAPLYVLLLGPLILGERPTRGSLLAVPVFALGLVLFFLDQLTPGQQVGNLVALASGLTFALCIVGLRSIREEGDGAAAWGNLLAVLVGAPLALGGPLPTVTDVALVAFLGVFQLGLAYSLFARGVRDTPALEASLLVLLEPVLSPIWAFALAGERPGPWALAGGSVILVATAWKTIEPLWARRGTRASA